MNENRDKKFSNAVEKVKKKNQTFRIVKRIMARELNLDSMQSSIMPTLDELNKRQQDSLKRKETIVNREDSSLSSDNELGNEDECSELRMQKRRRKKERRIQVLSELGKGQKKKLMVSISKKWFIRYSSELLFKWDMFVIVLAIWNAIYIPFSIAFEPAVASNPVSVGFNFLIDFLFLIDIIVNFRTTFIDKEGIEVYDPRKIAKRYILGGRFWIDFFSTIPLDAMSGGSVKPLQVLRLLKLARLSRLSKII